MSKSIVFKLFLMTMGLCFLIIIGIFLGQTLFFKQFYVHQKVEKVEEALQSFQQSGLIDVVDTDTARIKEQEIYAETNAWMAVLDEKGYFKYADDYEMQIQLEPSSTSEALSEEFVTIPLYTMMDVERAAVDNVLFPDYLHEGKQLALEGIMVEGKIYPQRISRSASSLREENRLENRRLVTKEYEVSQKFTDPTEYFEHYPSVLAYGTVKKIHLPQGDHASRYTNRLFIDRINDFQADLLYGDDGEEEKRVTDYKENGIEYKIFLERITDQSGNPAYLIAMTSLQPVNEAMNIMQNYYIFILIGALLLVILASLYFSRLIAAPLLQIDKMTQKMAKLDFSEKIPIKTKDEIGNLSQNINQLSDMLNDHIKHLEQDIEKEKRMEETRKQFIAGVSHELKTPLSVLESCLYILKDKPDTTKREYYFNSMEDEVKGMNILVGDMLELARYESGTYKLSMKPLRIDEVLERVCVKLAPDIAEKKLHLQTRLIPVEVIANRSRIEQVLVNFMMNAIRYTPEQHKIIVTMVDGEDVVNINIENKGTQIPTEQMEKIWDRFYRGEHSRHRSTGGTGLGLAISRQILELHDVRYGVMNTEDGVMFYFELMKNKKV
ncbi:HAMP domain-containing sensor histidine kinase [Paenibacillus sp. ClWae2A]|uniref:sensor histidine kinase n=1 Tax=Paenibacillus sp. ClWae2A TaxID=3057177 RepID=UPI0028F57DB6|nr:HAMP domain-containing sensor histidine kinase [Paenibacillus sp. ClWae2A]MDT9717881.1 HAMP domain-containing sensor histidine kinase [Paenibacillus sp. ClWae2A]